jgi:hypothetical protein
MTDEENRASFVGNVLHFAEMMRVVCEGLFLHGGTPATTAAPTPPADDKPDEALWRRRAADIRARVEKTSGDAAYDLAALRAVTAAHPLPPLPPEFKGSVIRVHFGFEYSGRG